MARRTEESCEEKSEFRCCCASGGLRGPISVSTDPILNIFTQLHPHSRFGSANLRNIPAGLRNIPADLRNIHADLRNIPADLRNIPANLRNIPADPRNIHADLMINTRVIAG